ncbi:NADH kinase [Euphorbia lathyris]|uniref:NADH kinase n=1 Tax=Euphorbia lathyris TaxID=212925 RepID=UPI003313E7B3
MAIRRVLLLLKPLDTYPHSPPHIQLIHYLNNRRKVHKDTINFCQHTLQQKLVDWVPLLRTHLFKTIRDFDLVVTVGGDGTLLQASHFMDDSIPILGVNSDPTQLQEVEEFSGDFDATRSTGYLCAATAKNFEKVLDDILGAQRCPSNISRLSVSVNSKLLSTSALNDILIAHPCPAAVSRFSFKIQRDGESCSPLANCRSSGVRVSTAVGSTAAMLSAGGFVMPILSQDLQYMVREPISPGASISTLMHGIIESDQSMEIRWFSEKGAIYIDGSHVTHSLQYGDTLQISSTAPVLKIFLPQHML